jgi:hypothetical protein
MSAPHRLRDLADVQDLITTLKLPLEFAERLDASVRETFLKLMRSPSRQDQIRKQRLPHPGWDGDAFAVQTDIKLP